MFNAVDRVTFPEGMNLRWEAQQAVREYFLFDD